MPPMSPVILTPAPPKPLTRLRVVRREVRQVKRLRAVTRSVTIPTGAGTLHVGIGDGKRNENAPVVIMSGHHGSKSEPCGTDSGPKTEICVDETAKVRRENGKKSGESDLVHEIANG